MRPLKCFRKLLFGGYCGCDSSSPPPLTPISLYFLPSLLTPTDYCSDGQGERCGQAATEGWQEGVSGGVVSMWVRLSNEGLFIGCSGCL
jgi:hypothetical protein